jgi:RNA polymerase II subunit A C-terminal domain phosphatase
MRIYSLRSFRNDSSASIRISHSDPTLKVTHKEAIEIDQKHLSYLVKHKKLVLLVDLDHTLLHTTNENVIENLPVSYI